MFAMFLVYLASNVQGVIDMLQFVTTAGILFLGAWLLFFLMDSTGNPSVANPFKHKIAKWFMWIVIVSGLLGTLLPKERTVYMMAAAYMGQTVIQSDTGKKIGNILEKKLDKYLEEMDSPVQLPKSVNDKSQ